MNIKPSLQNLVTRAIAGFFFIVIVIAAILGGKWSLGILFYVITMLGMHECTKLISKQPSVMPRYTGGFIIATLIYAFVFLLSHGMVDESAVLWIIPFWIALFIFELFYREKFSLTHIGATAAGWIYVVIPFAMINPLATVVRHGTFDAALPIGFFILLWTNDTGAYLSGRYFGKHKLYERISPNKTWEGLIGGMILTMSVALILPLMFGHVELNIWLIVAALIAVFANLGDLFESLVKRGVGVKDSGNILPGHGGVLDRFDGLLFALPVVFFYLKIYVYP